MSEPRPLRFPGLLRVPGLLRFPGLAPRDRGAPIVPERSVSGRTLVLLIAIMTFLSGVTLGGVVLVQKSAIAWSSDVGREVALQFWDIGICGIAEHHDDEARNVDGGEIEALAEPGLQQLFALLERQRAG